MRLENFQNLSMEKRIKLMEGLEKNYLKKLCNKLKLNFLKKCKKLEVESK